MRKLFFIFMLLCSMSIFAQQTSLTVDNQTPGWLSSKINYSDQMSVENLTVTGYLNGTDIKFLRELNLSANNHLQVLNLRGANLVSGGEAYYKSKVTEDNVLTEYLFADLNPIRKLVLPNSIDKCMSGNATVFGKTQIDSLIMPPTKIIAAFGDYCHIGYLEFQEGTEEINLAYFFHTYSYKVISRKKIVIPSTVTKIDHNTAIPGKKTVIDSYVDDPHILTPLLYNNSNGTDTIYVPKGTVEDYSKTNFKYWKIIERQEIESISLSCNALEVFTGDHFMMTASLTPLNVEDDRIEWSSTDENVATVDNNGFVTAKGFGQARIYAKSKRNNSIEDYCDIQVYEHCTGVRIDHEWLSLNVGMQEHINAYTLPRNETNNLLVWSSDSPSICAVDNDGNIRTLKPGICKIKATSVDGDLCAECEVIVNQPVTNVSLNTTECILYGPGSTYSLIATLEPADATNKEIIWKSSNENVCVVVDGRVIAIKEGLSVITAISKEKSDVSAICIVQVKEVDKEKKYDVNNDGHVSITDANVIIDYLLKGNK